MTQTTKKPAHHHGDLRNALIQAGIDLLEDGGINALTLRKCAARAGVSHAAPAHHFDGLAGLKQAIAERGFEIFATYLKKTRDAGDPSDLGRLKSVCRGYLQFGLDHPGILTVIFGARGLAGLTALSKPQADAYLILRSVCAPFVPPDQPPEILETQVWSLIHGFTLLFLDGEFGPPDTALADQLFAPLITLLDPVARTAP